MRTIIFILLCSVAFSTPSFAQGKKDKKTSNAESHRLMAGQFLSEVWTKGNVDIAKKILQPDFKFILAFTTVNGLEDFLALVRRNRTTFENLTYVPTDIVADEGGAVAYWQMSTTKNIGPWRGVPASQKPVAIEGMSYYKFKDGKIAEIRVQNDVFSMLRQLGFVSAPEVVEKNKQLVREYAAAILGKRDFSQFSKFADPSFKIDRSAVPEAIAGAAGLNAQMDMLYKAFPDLEIQIADMIASNDKVLVRFEAPGTHTGDFIGIKPTGKKVVWKGLVLYHIKDGKLIHAWANWDDTGLINQLTQK
ncbi:MAG: ester cyclase [Ignavibacteria bacterium]|nr:ester cyclase [Ignavibacteria bacterium]